MISVNCEHVQPVISLTPRGLSWIWMVTILLRGALFGEIRSFYFYVLSVYDKMSMLCFCPCCNYLNTWRVVLLFGKQAGLDCADKKYM